MGHEVKGVGLSSLRGLGRGCLWRRGTSRQVGGSACRVVKGRVVGDRPGNGVALHEVVHACRRGKLDNVRGSA